MLGFKFQILLSVTLVLDACSNSDRESSDLKHSVSAEASEAEAEFARADGIADYQAIVEAYASARPAIDPAAVENDVAVRCREDSNVLSGRDLSYIDYIEYYVNCRKANSIVLRKVVGGLAALSTQDAAKECIITLNDIDQAPVVWAEAERSAPLKTSYIIKPVEPSIQIFAYYQGQEFLVYEASQQLRTLSLETASGEGKVNAFIDFSSRFCS